MPPFDARRLRRRCLRDRSLLRSGCEVCSNFFGQGANRKGWSPEALAEQIGHLDEEVAAVAPEAGLELARERAETIPIQIVVVADVKSGAGIRRPAKQKLPFVVRRD